MPDLSTALLDVAAIDDNIWQLTLNRPDQRNALSIELRDDMSRALDWLAADDHASVVVVTGAGPVFCAGFDLREFDRAREDADFSELLWASSNRWHDTLRRSPLPIVASMNGPALAGGFDLATMCDLRIATRSCYLARPEVEWTVPVYSIVRDLVGGALARELALTNRRIDADEALRIHLLSRVVDDDELASATLALAKRLRDLPRDGVRKTKATALQATKVATEGKLTW